MRFRKNKSYRAATQVGSRVVKSPVILSLDITRLNVFLKYAYANSVKNRD